MLNIIGSGFGRTGTVSLKTALERLGVGPCYHMMEVFAQPGHIADWSAAADGAEVWPGPLAGYKAAIDWPAAAFWPELARRYPEAKVIHTERPEDEWYRSFCRTIQKPMIEDTDGTPPGWFDMVRKVIVDKSLNGELLDEAAIRAAYRQNNAAVRDRIAPDRLLIFSPADGWEPLCAFLDVEVPDEPYPHLNTTEEFQKKIGI